MTVHELMVNRSGGDTTGMPVKAPDKETPWQRLDAAILRAADAQQALYQALQEARLEASAAPDLPLLARLNGWLHDLNRMWIGRGPEETSGDSGLKHYANAVRKRRVQTMSDADTPKGAHEEDEGGGCPEVETDVF